MIIRYFYLAHWDACHSVLIARTCQNLRMEDVFFFIISSSYHLKRQLPNLESDSISMNTTNNVLQMIIIFLFIISDQIDLVNNPPISPERNVPAVPTFVELLQRRDELIPVHSA